MLAQAGKMRGNSNLVRSKRPLSSAIFSATSHHFFSGFFTYNPYKWRTYVGFGVFYLKITYNKSNIWLTRHISVNSALRKRRISTEKLKNSTPTNFSILTADRGRPGFDSRPMQLFFLISFLSPGKMSQRRRRWEWQNLWEKAEEVSSVDSMGEGRGRGRGKEKARSSAATRTCKSEREREREREID